MALPATLVYEVRDTGNNNNGGGYSSGGTDYSQQASAQYATTTATTSGAGAVINWAAAANDMVGNNANIVSGTNFTAGIYNIQSVVVGVSITVDRACCTGIGSNGVINVGGAWANLTDALAENLVGGNVVHIKKGSSSYSPGAISLTAAGTETDIITLIGYNATRGDLPTIASGNQPTLDFGANALTLGAYFKLQNITITGTSATLLTLGTGGVLERCKVSNTSGTAGRSTVSMNGGGSAVIACDVSSTNGIAITTAQFNMVLGCYIHDSDIGWRTTSATGTPILVGNIIETIVSAAVQNTSGTSGGYTLVMNNTLYGASTPTGSSYGLQSTTSYGRVRFYNNIIYGFVTGAANNASMGSVTSDFNCFFNNTTARTNWPTGANDIATDPTFVNAATGNFSVGSNMKAMGFPNPFPGSICRSYVDIGAIQRLEDYPVVGDVKSGTVYSNSELTGTQANITGGGVVFTRRR